METARVLGETVEFRRTGSGTPLLFLHGLGADSRQSATALAGLAGTDLICPDMPGHGASPPGPASFDDFAALAVGLLDHLGIERAAFGGISMGAGIALRAALDHPDRVAGLVLVRPAWIDHPALPHLAIVARIGRWLAELSPTVAAARLEIDRDFIALGRTNQPAADSIRGLITRPQAVAGADLLHTMVHQKPFDHLRDLEEIACPALVATSSGDPLHPVSIAQLLYGRLANAQLHHLPPRYLAPGAHFAALTGAVDSFLHSEEFAACSQPAPRPKRSLPS